MGMGGGVAQPVGALAALLLIPTAALAPGVVRVTRILLGERQEIATLTAGDFFGKMALLHGTQADRKKSRERRAQAPE